MRKTILTGTIILAILAFPAIVKAQCTPGDATTCPDLENNGEICPETLPNAIFGEAYSQEFTILAPAEYIIDSASGTAIDLHHITLKSIDNIPPGITWLSNSEDSVFLVGTYYCVLLEGLPTDIGNYPLKIVIDVYIPGIFGSPPIFVATVTETTSLFMKVTDPSGLPGYRSPNLINLSYSPNPFKDRIEVRFTHSKPGPATFDVFNLLGENLFTESINTYSGENIIQFDGSDLEPGVYLFSVRDSMGTSTGRIIKSN